MDMKIDKKITERAFNTQIIFYCGIELAVFESNVYRLKNLSSFLVVGYANDI